MKIAQRLIAGDVRRKTVRVPEGRQSGTQPSLRDFVTWASPFPALKRWAIVDRPSGTSLAGIRNALYLWIIASLYSRAASPYHASL